METVLEIVLTFAQTRDAILAERELLARKLPVYVMPLPTAIDAGCGLALRLAADDFLPALAALRLAGVVPAGAYRREIAPGRIGYTHLPFPS